MIELTDGMLSNVMETDDKLKEYGTVTAMQKMLGNTLGNTLRSTLGNTLRSMIF